MHEGPNQVLSEEYEGIYDRMLADLSTASIKTEKQREITAFWPMRGMYFEENVRLMVIGRAVNGWTVKGCPENEDDLRGTGWDLEDLKLKENRQQLLDGIRYLSESSEHDRWQLQKGRKVNIRPKLEIGESKYSCPLSWVEEKAGSKRDSYNTNTSAFWRVNKAILEKLHPETNLENPWSSYLCWSNLYKIAPLKTGNPSKSSMKFQRESAIKLLKLELEAFKPKHVLVVAGRDWYFPFVKSLEMQFEDLGKDNLVEGAGHHDGQLWVFAKHPQTKPEKQFTSEVVEAFTKLDG